MAFSFYRSLTIDHTKCGAADSANFPVLVSISHATFKSVANGGNVQHASAYDVIFTSDIGGVTKIPWEIEFYDPVNGILVAWVLQTTLSKTTDNVFYVFYGDSGISTAQNTGGAVPTAVWVNYAAVWHLGNGTTLSALDSTGNGNDGTLVNTPTATAGKIDGAASFSHASNQYINAGAGTSLAISGNLSVEIWLRCTAATFAAASGWRPFSCLVNSGGWKGYEFYAGSNVFEFQRGTAGGIISLSGITASAATTYHIIATNDGTTTNVFTDGALAGRTASQVATVSLSGQDFLIGQYSGGGAAWEGWIDELRISTVVRNASWALASYNNQNAPGNIGAGNFITFGAEVSGGPIVISYLLTDTLSLSDTLLVNRIAVITQTLVDAILLTDAIGDSVGDAALYNYSISDTLALSDTLEQLIVGASFPLADSLLLSDAIALKFTIALALSDRLTFTDTLSLAAVAPGLLLSDFLNLNDAIATQLTRSLALADTLTLLDSFGESHQPPAADTLVLSDSVAIAIGYLIIDIPIGISDNLVLSDSITLVAPGAGAGLADQISLSDSVDLTLYSNNMDYIRRYANDVQ